MAQEITVNTGANPEEWCANFEKDFDAMYKAMKKMRDSLRTKPVLSATTDKKYQTYLNMLVLEIQDAQGAFPGAK